MLWGYKVGEVGYPPLPLHLPIDSHSNALITGCSGSGKSFSLLFLVGTLLQENPHIVVTFCDFKNSDDFEFLKGYEHYYSGDSCYDGIMKYYETFSALRVKGRNRIRHLLIVDEYPAMVNYLSMKDKQNKTKKANDILCAISEILMLGRGLQFGLWIVTQRADASLFSNGSRDSFMIICLLGRSSREQRLMLLSGEDIPDKVYQVGEGVILADSHPLYEIAFPKFENITSWKRHIKRILMNNPYK